MTWTLRVECRQMRRGTLECPCRQSWEGNDALDSLIDWLMIDFWDLRLRNTRLHIIQVAVDHWRQSDCRPIIMCCLILILLNTLDINIVEVRVKR
jgi:hypothetical protein